MKSRHVFSTSDLPAAEAAVNALRRAGVPDDDISLIARQDIQKAIADDRLDTSGDFGRGGVKGVLMGGGSGLLCGLVATAVPAIGLPVAGAAAMVVAGAAMGGWMGMLTGTAEPDAARRKFQDEIDAGCVIVAVDGEKDLLDHADAVLLEMRATRLPFEVPTALS
jgi:hypothetical protein